ncbi:Athe_2463 domain-containing protein [Paenibacillus chartarius]|uniref:Athe_2463 domain-containing protein n=1 Tax=Paenibacillus chartarius TaxID=747481 RepID=A0ABV6DHI0_9BACL
MEKNKKIFFGLMVITGLCVSIFAYSNLKSEADTIDLGSKVERHWDDGNGNQVRDTSQSPTYITFKPGTIQYREYGDRKFWQRLHENQFLVYSPIEPKKTQRNNANMDLSIMIENRVQLPDRDYWKLVDPDWNQNLKLGSIEPGYQSKDMYRGDNTGTTTLTGSKYFDKKYEWRFIGVGSSGVGIQNPFFPPDYPVETKDDWRPELKNWIEEPWNHFTSPSPYDDPSMREQKVSWFEKYFFKQNPSFVIKSLTLKQNAEYWAKYFTLHNNPDESTGIVTGWHKTASGRVYYASFIMATPPQSNLRLIDYQIHEKQTGKLIAQQTIDESNDTNTEKKLNTVGPYVEAGKTYTITAKVKNMIIPGLNGKDTKHQPIRLYQAYKVDDDVYTYNYTVSPNENVYPTNQVTTIQYGKSVDFSKQKDRDGKEVQWEFTVPTNAKKEITFEAGIDYGFYLAGENIYQDDDFAEIRLKIKPEDIGVTKDAILIDQNGKQVEDVVPYQTYSLRFFVKKFAGDAKVGDSNDPKNPYASVDVAVSDKGTITKYYNQVKTKEMITKEGQVVQIDVPNAITPSTPMVEATWQLAQLHRDNGQSQIFENDGPYKKLWASEINISVNNFKITPPAFMLPVGQNSTTETVSFNFDVMNHNVENQDKDIEIVIKKGGQVIWSDTISIPANRIYTVPTITVPAVNLSGGENAFSVEVNPPPRKWFEFLKDGSDPYADNIAFNSVMVHPNQPASQCLILNNENTWSTTHYLREWHGYRVYWTHCTKSGCHQHSYCVTTSDVSWTETIDYYERYTISAVMFRSKLTKDQAIRDGANPGDPNVGWVDIANGRPGEVKAGYGFEIKYIVTYRTNTFTASPKPWHRDCSGKTVNPRHGSPVDAPNSIQVAMPFNDKSGQPVKYNLNSTSESGRWDNLTQTYEMPYHNAFNMKQTREIYTNVTAKDGDYPIRIDTYPYFYGSYDKPQTSKFLCDYKIVNIRVRGADTDDIKSHLTQ